MGYRAIKDETKGKASIMNYDPLIRFYASSFYHGYCLGWVAFGSVMGLEKLLQ